MLRIRFHATVKIFINVMSEISFCALHNPLKFDLYECNAFQYSSLKGNDMT